MKAATHIMKPKNWQDFEKLCKLLWGEVWNCEDNIKQPKIEEKTENITVYNEDEVIPDKVKVSPKIIEE